MAALNEKQLKFCQEYIVDMNGTQAAIRAGYSAKTANEQAARLLANVSIKSKIKELKKKQAERVEYNADKVLNELAKVAFADITDFVVVKEIEVEEYPAGFNAEQLPVKIKKTIVEVLATAKIAKIKRGVISEIKQTSDGISLKIFDKLKALEMLGRHLALFNDKLIVNADEELKNLYKTVMSGK